MEKKVTSPTEINGDADRGTHVSKAIECHKVVSDYSNTNPNAFPVLGPATKPHLVDVPPPRDQHLSQRHPDLKTTWNYATAAINKQAVEIHSNTLFIHSVSSFGRTNHILSHLQTIVIIVILFN